MFYSLRTSTERIWMISLPPKDKQYTDKAEGYDRNFEATSKQCFHVATNFTNFTVHILNPKPKPK